MRERVSHITWLRVMPLRQPPDPVARAQETVDVTEHECAAALETMRRHKTHEARNRFLFWAEEYRNAERALLGLVHEE